MYGPHLAFVLVDISLDWSFAGYFCHVAMLIGDSCLEIQV